MRTVIQRVSEASVTVEGEVVGSIQQGLLLLIGIEAADTEEDLYWLCSKIVKLRIFNDKEGKMNQHLFAINGDILLVSQFTLHASYKKGNRPSFINAARPEQAIPLYKKMIAALEALLGKPIQTGIFGATMKVALVNDGPVTILMDSKMRE